MKKNLNFYITLWIVKLISAGLKLLGKNATYYPGKLALDMCPGFMGMFVWEWNVLKDYCGN